MRDSSWRAEGTILEDEHDKAPYRSFLIRCWREGDPVPAGPALGANDQSPWRFMVLEVGGTQRWRGLTSVEDLTNFLRSQLGC